MSSTNRLLFATVAIMVMTGVALVCHQTVSTAQSKTDRPKAETISAEGSFQKQSSPASQSDEQFLQAIEDEIGGEEYWVEVFGPKSGMGTVLGVHVSEASPALRKHLKLPHQFGLLIEHVEPKSAAADAQLERFDVLFKLGDQMLVNQEQLTALVRMHKPKDSIAVTVFREGAAIQIDVVLKAGPITDESGADWNVGLMQDFDSTAHATNPKFKNCHSCHTNPHPVPRSRN